MGFPEAPSRGAHRGSQSSAGIFFRGDQGEGKRGEILENAFLRTFLALRGDQGEGKREGILESAFLRTFLALEAFQALF